MSHGHRLVEVDPARLPGWVVRFGERHGGPGVEADATAVRLTAQDGATAVLEVPWPPLPNGSAEPVERLAAHAAVSRTALLLLVRRGGFSVGLARDGTLLDHSTGTRYVQGRTAAGGWSQQRFARRRTGQADALVGACADTVAAVLARAGRTPTVLVPGGDRGLLADVLADPRLAAAAALPRGPLLDVREPRLEVLRRAAERARAVRVRVEEP